MDYSDLVNIARNFGVIPSVEGDSQSSIHIVDEKHTQMSLIQNRNNSKFILNKLALHLINNPLDVVCINSFLPGKLYILVVTYVIMHNIIIIIF